MIWHVVTWHFAGLHFLIFLSSREKRCGIVINSTGSGVRSPDLKSSFPYTQCTALGKLIILSVPQSLHL